MNLSVQPNCAYRVASGREGASDEHDERRARANDEPDVGRGDDYLGRVRSEKRRYTDDRYTTVFGYRYDQKYNRIETMELARAGELANIPKAKAKANYRYPAVSTRALRRVGAGSYFERQPQSKAVDNMVLFMEE